MSYFQKIENKKDWQELLSKAHFKTFFHSLKWEEFLEKEFHWLKFDRYLYRDELLLSLVKYRALGKERLISHPFCEYGGPLPLKREIEGREFRKNLFLEFTERFKISFHPMLPQYFTNLALKEPDSSRDTYFIENLNEKSEEEIFSSFRKTLRHSIKKAQGENLMVEKCGTPKDLRDFYSLYVKTIKRHKTIPYPFSFFQYFFVSPRWEIILAKFKNKLISGSVFVSYDKFIHYFLNASDIRHKKQNANCLILWSQIKEYVGYDYQVFDLGGTKRGSSLEIFKKGWGAKKYPIFEIKNYKESKIRESPLRNILSVLPNFLIKKLSPQLLKYKL